MDGGRGYFSAASAVNPGAGSTRTRPVSAGTRLRQKPAAAGAHQDFFASLGIDSQPSRTRTGSSTSTSSNRSFNNITLRGSGATAVAGSPAAAALAATSASSTSTSTFGGWQSGASGSSIGGIGRSSQRGPLPDHIAALATTAVHAHPPASTTQMMGSGDSMSATTTTTTTTTNVSGDGMKAFSGAVSSTLSGGSVPDTAALSAASQPKPTQLFSMEDADDLFSDDGWGCDSPSTVLSNPMEETESTSAAAKETKQDEDFGWGDDDDAFVSPVAKPFRLAQPPQQQHQVHFEEPDAAQDVPFAAASTSSNAFETQHVTVTPPLPVAAPSASFSVSSTGTSAFENEAANATAPPPPVTAPPTELPSEDSRHNAEQTWDSQWDQQVSSDADGDVAEAKTTSVSTVTATTTMTTTTTMRTERFGGAAVELTSPAGAAGEFWGDPDDDALFDHDDHADEEWDESIKKQEESQNELALHAHAKDEILAVASAPIPEASSSLPAPPPPATATFAVASTREGELMSAPGKTASVFDRASYSKEYHVSNTETLDRSFGDVQESTVAAESATETVPSSGLPDPTLTTHSEHDSIYASGADSQEVEAAAVATESSFSSAMDAPPTHENDLNVFPEAPPAVRFLHTPTGTGGPFGRVPSPQGHDGPSLGEEYSSFDASDGHDATEATARTTTTGAGEKREEAQTSELYAEASVRWDLGSTATNGLEHAVAEEATEHYPEEIHREVRQGQSDEEERDSVVSFSGGAGNSFFPSAGRPSSLYGGSQSSFASHRMYQSSTASTDHDGSSIASFGVSSAGATFGGSERVSEGGAFSDGTASETPSMVDSSNASTAFGTDFPSVSEGQFSAPGTTIGGSDNASDGGFSDGNASETTSMCESVNTNSAFVSEFRATTGHYVTETVQHGGVQEPFASSTVAGSSTTTFSASAPPAAATMFGGDDSLTDANPFASAPSAFPSRSPSRTPPSPPAAPVDRNFNQSSTPNEEEYVPSAASLFGATAGADVPNVFSSFSARPAAPTAEATPVVEHELPTSDASDLFGSAPAASGFGNSFSQPAHQSYNSGYQSYDQGYNQSGHGSYADSRAPAFGSASGQAETSHSFDGHAGAVFGAQGHSSVDPFATQSAPAQHTFGSPAPTAESMFSGGGYGGSRNPTTAQSVSSQFSGGQMASAESVFGGRAQTRYDPSQGHFNQQPGAFGSAPLQSAGNSYGEQGYDQYGQGAVATSGFTDQASAGPETPDHFRQQTAASAFGSNHAQTAANAFSGQSYDYNERGAAASNHFDHAAKAGPGTPDHFSGQTAAGAFGRSPAHPAAGAFNDGGSYSSQPFGQRSTPGTPDSYSRQSAAEQYSSSSPAQLSYGGQQAPGTPDHYSRQSAADMFANSSPAQPTHDAQQTYSSHHYGQSMPNASGSGFGSQTPPAPSVSANAFFGRSATEDASSAATHLGEGGVLPPSKSFDHPAQAQASLSRSVSNSSSYADQYATQRSADGTPTRPRQEFPQPQDLNTSYDSVEDHTFGRHASSSSIGQYGYEEAHPSQSPPQQLQGGSSAPAASDPSAFFGQSTSSAHEVDASSFFGRSSSQDSAFSTSESHIRQTQESAAANIVGSADAHSMSQFPSSSSLHSMGGASYYDHDHDSEQFGASSPAPVGSMMETKLMAAGPQPTGVTDAPTTTPETSHEQYGYGDFGGSASTSTGFDAAPPAPAPQQSVGSPFSNGNAVNDTPAYDGFGGSAAASFGHGPGRHGSSDFFSSAPAPQATAAVSTPFEHGGYGNEMQQQQQHQQQHVHDAASASLQLAEAHSSFQQPRHAVYGGTGAHASNVSVTATNNYYQSGMHGAASSPADYSQQQFQHDDINAHQYMGESVSAQPQDMGYNSVSHHQYGTAASGYGMPGMDQDAHTHTGAAAVVKTSNKYKDPCVAPPSCLASFGFGGNVVTMFPKRKLRLNIAGSSFRNSPRGAPAPSQFDSTGNGELRKGPVSVYRMEQLHPQDKEFEKMEAFPGPLTDGVSEESVLEYLDDRLKRSETPTSANEVEDENDRLLVGVLRIMVKCNGKLRSDPGAANPSDPDSPEAQLVALLNESSQRRRRNQSATFPAPRSVQSASHPDAAARNVSKVRELLLVGERKDAVSAAMNAQMWPEAMLIASFTDKEEYKRVLRTYLDEHYATGDPCRALFMSFADQQEKSVQEPKKLLQTHEQHASPILSNWVTHAQVLLANRTADTNKILTELGDRLWKETDAVAAAHVCYLLAGVPVEAPSPSSKIALLGGDHRTPKEARFYVSPAAVQRTEVYEWVQKHAKGPSTNLMIPFQGYKLIYAMLLADHGKLETAFKYVTSMLTVIKAVMATMKPGTSMYLEGMKNQLTVLDDRLRQHLGQDRVASVAASTSRSSGRKLSGKWGLGSALSMVGKIVNRVVEGNDASSAASSTPNASTPGGLYGNEVTAAASYPSIPSVSVPSPSPTPSYPQQHVQQTPPSSSHGPSPVPAGSYGHPTPPMSQGSAPGSSNGYARGPAAPGAGPYARLAAGGIPPSGPYSGNGRHQDQQQHQQPSGPYSGNGHATSSGPYSNNGPPSRGHPTVPLMRSQQSMEAPGSNHSNSSVGYKANSTGLSPAPMSNGPYYSQQQQQPPSETSQHAQVTNAVPPAPTAAFQKPSPLDFSGNAGNATTLASQSKVAGVAQLVEAAAMLPPPNVAPPSSGPASDKGKASPKFKTVKKPARSKTPPPSSSSKSSGWFSGLSSFIATKMNPDAKVAKLGEHMEAYFDEENKRWVFPGETAAEEPAMPSAPPTGPLPGSAPGSSAAGPPPSGTNSAPGSISGFAPSDDPLAALMAPPPPRVLMKKDPLAAMMAPPSRPGLYGSQRGGSSTQRKPPRPQFAVFKPSPAAAAPAPDQQPSE